VRIGFGVPCYVGDSRRAQAVEWGATHLICSIGGRPFTLWSDAMLELFASEVIPRVRRSAR
jgi:hypothetical protein